MRVRVLNEGFVFNGNEGFNLDALLEKAKNIKSIDEYEMLCKEYGEADALTAFNMTHNTLEIDDIEYRLEECLYNDLMYMYVGWAIEAEQEAAV